MALLQTTRVLPNERLDLPDFQNIEAFVCADFSAIHKNVWTNGNFVMSGFDVLSPSIGSNTLQIKLAGSTCVLGRDTGSLFIGAPSLDPLTTSVLTPGTINYVELTIDTDTGGADSRAFWDQTANGGSGGEFAQIIDTYSFLKASFAINTAGFTNDADKIKIAAITVNSSGVITLAEDARDLFFRLGRGSNTSFTYPWASRTEPTSTQFSGADKDLKNLKNILDALMDSLREVKGTAHWYEVPNVSLQGSLRQISSTIIGTSSSSQISWDGAFVTITDSSVSPLQSDVVAAIRIFSSTAQLNLTRQSGSSAIALGDQEVLWVQLANSGTVNYDGVGITSTNYQVSALGAMPVNDSNYWIAYREGDRLYVRDLGELESGESVQVSDSVPDALKEFLGFDPETATSVPYTTVPNSAIFSTTFNNSSSLVTAISVLAFNLNGVGAALDSNIYDEYIEIVDSSPVGNQLVGPITSGTNITIPTDSRDSSAQEKYVVGSGNLQLILNGQVMILNDGWAEVGTAGDLSQTIQILQDLKVGDKVVFRVGALGGFNVGEGSGEANTASNVGSGAGVFKQKSGVDLQFKTLVAGSNASITETATSIIISATGGGSGGGTAGNTTIVTADYTVLGTDGFLVVDASSGAVVLSLPDATTQANKEYVIKKVDLSSNNVQIKAFGSQVIDGSSSLNTTTPYQSFTIRAVGNVWYIV